MNKIIAYTQAYNAEKTVARTIESMLSQTRGDFIYYILDNGSTDNTGQIIRAYAEKDPRIVTLANAKNSVWETQGWLEFLNKHDLSHYFCALDSDDEYKPDFLEKMTSFVEKNNLDVAACGNDFLDAVSGEFLGPRVPAQDLLLEGDSFGDLFPHYHVFTRSYWAILFSLAQLQGWQEEPAWWQTLYGQDTIFTQYAFSRAKRAGVLAESLHKYYQSPQSLSYGFDIKRVHSSRVLFDYAKKFLMEKVGKVSRENEKFLHEVRLNEVKSALIVLYKAEMSTDEKLGYARQLKLEVDEIQQFFNS